MTVEDVFRRLAEKREAWLRSQETFDVEESFGSGEGCADPRDLQAADRTSG